MPKTIIKRKKSRAKTKIVAIPAKEAKSNGKAQAVIFAVFLLLLFLASIMSLIGGFGPYAEKLANLEVTLFGPTPLFLLLAACASLIVWIFLNKILTPNPESKIPFGHYALGFTLLYIFFSIILAIMMPDTLKAIPLKFEKASGEYAGFIGLFWQKKLSRLYLDKTPAGFCSAAGLAF